jgi:alpha-beta hydrolase superfamily lysophospholipase
MQLIIMLIALTLSTTPFVSQAGSDLEREKRLAIEVGDDLLDGESVYLNTAQGHSFLSIDTSTDTTPAKGNAIILHGRGYHPNHPTVAYPLRTGLIEKGWNTLSIQLPVLAKTAKYYDYVPIFPEAFGRINAAILYMKEQYGGKVVLIAHSCGSHMSSAWIRHRGSNDQGIQAYVGIGMGATDYQQKMHKPFALDLIKSPILDVYGSEEYSAVLRMAPSRLALIKRAGNPLSAQKVILGADHDFHGEQASEELVDAISDWLDTLN